MNRITVLIADDHALFREGLRSLLAQEKDIQVVGEAVNGLQAISMAEALQPGILLLDARMPEQSGIEALPQIREKSPRTKVLMISGFPEDELMVEALQLGAKGYLLKSLTSIELVKAIRTTYSGEVWAARRILTEVLENLRQKVQEMSVPFSEMRDTLTDREQEIVKWVTQGMTNKEIASRLGISDKTVKTHVRNVFNKLKISRRLELLLRRIVE